MPSDQKACSWIAKQAMTKKELDDACRVDSMDAEDADYYMTDQRASTDQCIDRADQSTWKQIAENEANFATSTSKPFTFGNLNSYVGFGNLLTPTMYGYRRTKFSQANMEKCCLGAGTFQQAGFGPTGASCTHGKNDCLSTWAIKCDVGLGHWWNLPPRPVLVVRPREQDACVMGIAVAAMRQKRGLSPT